MAKRRILAAFLALTLSVSGCSSAKIQDTSNAAETSAAVETTASETTAETTKAPEPFKFNPHVRTKLFDECVNDDMWNALHNLIDAVMAGEDTFKCTDEKAYKWCTDEFVIGNLLPPVCTLVKGAGFENGVGKIKYKMDKDKLKARIDAFVTEIERMMNEAIRTDYTDFEKTIAIYDYMGKNFQYDFSTIDGNTVDEFSDYACLMTKKGICCEISGAYEYLLLQCGVEAMTFSGQGESGFHEWTYVLIGGKGYHIDATWGLHGEEPSRNTILSYFMMTDEERIRGSFEEFIEPDWIKIWKADYDKSRYTATDTKFKVLHDGCGFAGMDTERKVIKYLDPYENSEHEFSYSGL